jgi:hypothetical protein
LAKKCPHNRVKNDCSDCGGASVCEHGRRRRQCGICGGISVYRTHAYHANHRGLTNELDEVRFRWLIAQPCIYCGQQPAGGVDRVKNEYGYTVLNSVPCCKACNYSKRDSPAPDYLANCARVVAHNSTYLAFKARWIETRTGGPSFQFSSTTAIPAVDQPSQSNLIH